jgi:hypothetical protein
MGSPSGLPSRPLGELLSQTYYRPGLKFKAHQKSQGHQEICRRFVPAQYTPDGAGIVRDEIPALIAEFAVHRGEYNYTDPDGVEQRAADMSLGWFDLDAQAEAKGWTDNDKEVVARHMQQMCQKRPGGDFSLWSKAPAQKPWPKYDEAHHNAVPTLAEQLGLVGEALLYEQENKNRATVVDKLKELLDKAQTEAVASESLTAA